MNKITTKHNYIVIGLLIPIFLMLPFKTFAFNLTSASYDNVSFSFVNEDPSAYDFIFNPDGTKMYMKGAGSRNIYQYTLSTPFDVSKATYDNVVSDAPNDILNIEGFLMSNDGTKVYIFGSNPAGIHQYTLSTPFDVGTLTSTSTATVFTTERNLVTGAEFSSDGTKLYTISNFIDEVYQYTLSTPFDVSTATYDNVTFDYSAQEANATGIVFNTDGTNMFINGTDNETLYQYVLTTPYDISTVSYDNVSLDLTTEAVSPSKIRFNNDYSKLYVKGTGDDTVYQYSLDQIDPEISSLSPTDDANNVPINTDLVITFSENVDVEAGNITIVKLLDDSIVEQIDVAGSKVSKTKSNEITINASTTLDYSTEYYVLIDATAFDDSNSNSFAGISATSTWNFNTESETVEVEEKEENNRQRSGTTLAGRIKNLEKQGKYEKAQELRDRFNLQDQENDKAEIDSSLSSIINILINTGIISEEKYKLALNSATNNNDASFVFSKDLELNNIDEDVRVLQKYLNNNGFIVSQFGPGSPGNETNIFGPLTETALIKFQNTNAKSILEPVGLISGTGYFGSSTRNFLNN